MDQDTEGGGALVLVPQRWRQDQIDRIEALHKATGLPRALYWRAVFDQGIGVVERNVAAVQVAEVGAVAAGTGEPA